METPTVLIISDEVDFSRRITARWQMERNVPTFTLLSGELVAALCGCVFDVAIVGQLRRDLLSVVLEPLHSTGQPFSALCRTPQLRNSCAIAGRGFPILRPQRTLAGNTGSGRR